MVHPSAFRVPPRNWEYENGAWYFDQNGQGYQRHHGEWQAVHPDFTPEEGINRDWQSPEGGYTRYAPGDPDEDVPLISPSTEGSNSPYNDTTHGQLPVPRENRIWEREVDNYFENYDFAEAEINRIENEIAEATHGYFERTLFSTDLLDLLALRSRLHQLRRYNPLQLNFYNPRFPASNPLNPGNRPGLDFYPNDYQEISSIRRRVRDIAFSVRSLKNHHLR